MIASSAENARSSTSRAPAKEMRHGHDCGHLGDFRWLDAEYPASRAHARGAEERNRRQKRHCGDIEERAPAQDVAVVDERKHQSSCYADGAEPSLV